MQEDQLYKELEASRQELRLLRAENEDLRRKVLEFESIIGDKERVHRCQVNHLVGTYATFEIQQCPDIGTTVDYEQYLTVGGGRREEWTPRERIPQAAGRDIAENRRPGRSESRLPLQRHTQGLSQVRPDRK